MCRETKVNKMAASERTKKKTKKKYFPMNSSIKKWTSLSQKCQRFCSISATERMALPLPGQLIQAEKSLVVLPDTQNKVNAVVRFQDKRLHVSDFEELRSKQILTILDTLLTVARMSEQTMPEKTEPMATAQPEDGVQQAEGRTADRVLDVKTCEGKRRFLVKWKGCPDSEDSWEPEENLDSTHLIEEFLNRQIRNQKQSKHADTMTAAKEKKVKNDDQKVDKDADESSFQPERVVGAGHRSGQLVFLMEWDSGVLCQISAKKANVKYPQIVIAFYESIMVWDTSKETDTGL